MNTVALLELGRSDTIIVFMFCHAHLARGVAPCLNEKGCVTARALGFPCDVFDPWVRWERGQIRRQKFDGGTSGGHWKLSQLAALAVICHWIGTFSGYRWLSQVAWAILWGLLSEALLGLTWTNADTNTYFFRYFPWWSKWGPIYLVWDQAERLHASDEVKTYRAALPAVWPVVIVGFTKKPRSARQMDRYRRLTSPSLGRSRL